MGHGAYNCSARTTRAESLGYSTKSVHEIFTEKTVNSEMNPRGIKTRESRDSADHPASLAIILALDVTGSMGSIPHRLVKDGLPAIMDGITKVGIADPQVLFLAIGDHECDRFPLQVGQFESSDALLDHWLTKMFVEGGGGGNHGESYLLAWYFAAKHTATDCWEKRKQKGVLFTIGDEPVLLQIPSTAIRGIMGEGQHETASAAELLDAARKTYDVYHIHVKCGSGHSEEVVDGWKQLMGPSLLIAATDADVPGLITETVKARSGAAGVGETSNEKPAKSEAEKVETML